MPAVSPLLGLRSLDVYYRHARKVGTLARTKQGVLAFQYDDAWLQGGFSISPLSLPLEKRVFVAKRHPLEGVFGVFNDSLPDGWGRLLVDRTLRKYGYNPFDVDVLARLSIVGESGMGALSYRPAAETAPSLQMDDLDELARDCERLLRTESASNLDVLFDMGGSSGGTRPKILAKVGEEDWIIKFPASIDIRDMGAIEYRYALAAQECGIEMPEVRLFSSKRCSGYFGVRRFDREAVHGEVLGVHMVSAAGLLETSHRIPNLDYDLLMRLTMRLTHDIEQVERLYRLMCFNVYAGNKDDHSKNFSFLYREDREAWVLSPAYDLTPSEGMNGEHATMVNGKGKSITLSDLVAVGERNGLSAKQAAAIAKQVRDVVFDRLGEINPPD